jgi:hypothetical protein
MLTNFRLRCQSWTERSKFRDSGFAVLHYGPRSDCYYQLHFNDYRAYSKIFSVGGHQFTKDPDFYACFGVETSTFGLIDPEKARLGRELLAPYFNRRSILQLESVIQTKVRTLCTW